MNQGSLGMRLRLHHLKQVPHLLLFLTLKTLSVKPPHLPILPHTRFTHSPVIHHCFIRRLCRYCSEVTKTILSHIFFPIASSATWPTSISPQVRDLVYPECAIPRLISTLSGQAPPYEQNVPYSTTTPAQPMMHQEYVSSLEPQGQ